MLDSSAPTNIRHLAEEIGDVLSLLPPVDFFGFVGLPTPPPCVGLWCVCVCGGGVVCVFMVWGGEGGWAGGGCFYVIWWGGCGGRPGRVERVGVWEVGERASRSRTFKNVDVRWRG